MGARWLKLAAGVLAIAAEGHTPLPETARAPSIATPVDITVDGRRPASGEDVLAVPYGDEVDVMWQLGAPALPCTQQAAYSVMLQAEGAPPTSVPLWQSGVVQSAAQCATLPPAALAEGVSVTVRVQVGLAPIPGCRMPHTLSTIAAAPVMSGWSNPVTFDVGLSEEGWVDSQWIGGFRRLRTQFPLATPSAVTRARVYIIGFGAFVLRVAGEQIGDHYTDPPETAYTKRTAYTVFNLTRRLRQGPPGEVAVAVELGYFKFGYMNIWCNTTEKGAVGCRSLRLRLDVEFGNDLPSLSVVTTVAPTAGWLGTNGPRIYDHEYHGEVFDMAQETPGWDTTWTVTPSSGWHAPFVRAPQNVTDAVLEPVRIPPMRRTETFSPIAVWGVLMGSAADTFHCPAPILGGMAPEGQNAPGAPMEWLNISCAPGTGTISKIIFADFGVPALNWGCTAYSRNSSVGGCQGSNTTMDVVERECLGKTACSIVVSTAKFGGDPCPDIRKRLAVVASGCVPLHPGPGKPTGNVSWVFDFGQNVAGTTSLSMPAQDVDIELFARHAERLENANGQVANSYCSNSETVPTEGVGCVSCGSYPGPLPTVFGGNCANQTWLLKVPAGTTIDFTTNFSSAGFRYVQLFGLPQGYDPRTHGLEMTSSFIHSDVPRTGIVSMGAVDGVPNGTPDILNAIQHMVVYTARSELHSIPTDCPQRERRGWMGDAHMSSNCQMLNNDMRSFYRHFLHLIRDDQELGCETPVGAGGQGCANAADLHGSLPDVVPFTTGPYGGFPGSPVWQAAYPVIVYNMWRNYGDVRVVQEHYAGLQALHAYWSRHADADGLVTFGGLGDWVTTTWPYNPTPTPAVAAFYTTLSIRYMRLFAEVLGLSHDAAMWSQRLNASMEAYHKRWYNATAKGYCIGSQTANVMALYLGVVPPELESGVLGSLVADIASHGNHTTSGIVGETFVFDVLASHGRDDIALAMLVRDDAPSFGYMVEEGATTVWENWKGSRFEQDGSWNHIMEAGGVGKFVYTSLAGIDTVDNATHAGFRHIIFRAVPAAIELMREANASVGTRYGTVAMSWALRGDSTVQYNVSVPAGTTAEISVPRNLLASELQTVWHTDAGGHSVILHGKGDTRGAPMSPPHVIAVRQVERPFSAVTIEVAGPLHTSLQAMYYTADSDKDL